MLNVDLTKKRNIIINKKNLSHIKIGNKVLKFGDIKIEKNKFYRHKSPNFLKGYRYLKSISI